MVCRSRRLGGFTLVEILIVVVILGILAALIVPALSGATGEAQVNATFTDLQKLRRAVGVYRAREGVLPVITDGDATGTHMGDGPWGPLVDSSPDGRTDYFRTIPYNAWVGGANGRVVVVVPNATPDTEYHTDYGWIYDPENGDILAAGFDANDQPLPRP